MHLKLQTTRIALLNFLCLNLPLLFFLLYVAIKMLCPQAQASAPPRWYNTIAENWQNLSFCRPKFGPQFKIWTGFSLILALLHQTPILKHHCKDHRPKEFLHILRRCATARDWRFLDFSVMKMTLCSEFFSTLNDYRGKIKELNDTKFQLLL